MTSLMREIWGRMFDLDVRFEDLDDTGISSRQWEAYGHILIDWQAIDASLSALKDYCIAENHDEFASEAIDNIFRYVIPDYLFVPDTPKKRTVALMCNYRFDPEHGIAIVFEDEELAEIGSQDIVL